jgi:hypothetical protein
MLKFAPMPLPPQSFPIPYAPSDSLKQLNGSSVRKDTASMFGSTLLSPKAETPKVHLTHYDYTVALILFLSFVLFVWLYTTNRKRLNQVIRSFYLSRYSSQMGREEVSLGNRVSIFLSTLFVVTLTLFILQVNAFYGHRMFVESKTTFLTIGGLIIAAYLVKIIVIRLTGFVFQAQKETGEYTVSVLLFGNTLGLFMMPVVICLAFARQISPLVFIYTGLSILATFLCARLVRGLIIGFNSSRVSGFYLFLYLCTLEILPFVILLKLFLLRIS